jgi:hypothetical protein
MTKILSAFALVALALPASATPIVREVINPNEAMVVVPNLEYRGPSRISTVTFCAELTQTEDWRNMITDEDLVLMDDCLEEHT